MYGLCRCLDPMTLTYISRSSNFYTFTSTFHILNYKAYNIKPCIVLLNVLTRQVLWPGDLDLYITLQWLTHFTSTFDISSTIRPTTTKPCIVLLLSVRTLQVPWSGDLDLYFVLQWLWHILRQRSISPQLRPTTTKPCIVLLLDVLTRQIPWPGDLDLYFVLQWLFTHFTSTFDISSTIRPTTTKPITVLHLDVLNRQVSWPGNLELYFTLQWLIHFTSTFCISSTIRPTTTIPCIVLSLMYMYWLGRYLDPVTLTYISSSSDLHILRRRSIIIEPYNTNSQCSLLCWRYRH